MAPKVSIFTARSVVCRSRPFGSRQQLLSISQRRMASEDAAKTPVSPGSKGPNQEQLPHVSEEQAAMDKTMGETPPDIGQGTPVKEMLSRDEEAKENAPQVIKDQINQASSGGSQKRSYSTSARRNGQLEQVRFQGTMVEPFEYPDAGVGHKFPLPDISQIPRTNHLKRRYDPIVDQVTKSMMRHGKLSAAQANMTQILDTLRTAPPPQANPASDRGTLLLEETHPRATMPLHPIEYLTTAIDSVAPLLKIRQLRGVAGGGAALPIPVPLGVRQRRRQAIQWILTAAENRKETKLADRVAREIINVAEGKSGVWERRNMVHRLAISARSNVKSLTQRRR